VEVEWDPAKAASNRRKHGVDFAAASTVLFDPQAITVVQDHPGEDRYCTVGMDLGGRVLVLVYTWRGHAVRIISARSATTTERERYREHP
jgi:uncharacterized protein